MSAEAADRVAIVASGRPSTPLQTSWFEFLLDSSLLETHLQKTNPGLCQHEMVSNGIKNVMLKCCFDGMIFFLTKSVSTDPLPVQLIVQFLEQASKPSLNEQNQVQPPADNCRNRTLKLLALKVAAHMKWDLEVLEKGSVCGLF